MAANPSVPDLGRSFCDLVMKGGVTSGVVYPAAIAGLAKRYRLRNIGGASAGAIAAAAAAAAEHGRQRAGTDAGFRRLEVLADELGNPPAQDPGGPSLLFHLFAPTPLSRPLFKVLADMLNQKSMVRRVARGLAALVGAFPATLVLGLAALAVIAVPLTVAVAAGAPAALARWGHPILGITLLALAGLLALVAVAAAIAGVVLAVDVIRALRHLALVMSRQDFGLCTGRIGSGGGPPALTDWLHGLLQELSGKHGATPLTFGDLRRIRFAETPGQDGIVLRLMTTCLSLGRPYTLPIQERLYFDPVELGKYFPEEIVRWMKEQSWRPRDSEDDDTDALLAKRTVDGEVRSLFPIPEPDDFPVLVATRMSLSFPILLSAIPLYRYTVRREDGDWVPSLQRLVFTDGGVCSNLPIHLFDSPLPDWPTFALNLRGDLRPNSPDEDRVVPPRRGRSYQGERYDISSDATVGAIGSFLVAIANTMQNWRDMLQREAPGARERVFTVRHTAEEGGLNLNMPKQAIDAMARSGARAASAIAETFLKPPGTKPVDDDWEYHRWVRLRLLLPVLREFLGELAPGALGPVTPPSIEEFLTDSPPPMGRSYELNQASRDTAWTFLEEVSTSSVDLEASRPDFERTAPRPPGELRVMPRF